MFDGLYGNREQRTINNLVWMKELRVNTSMLTPLQVTIRNDITLEEEECFELSIFPVNPLLMTENFECNTAGDEFFCQHEICIMDDDV